MEAQPNFEGILLLSSLLLIYFSIVDLIKQSDRINHLLDLFALVCGIMLGAVIANYCL